MGTVIDFFTTMVVKHCLAAHQYSVAIFIKHGNKTKSLIYVLSIGTYIDNT